MKRRKDFLIFSSPLIEQPEIDEVVATLKSSWLGTGPRVHKFEEMFKAFKGSKYAVALNSCTAALHLSMLAIDLKPQDEVIIPAMTFMSTANAVIHAGGKPVFVDCDRDTMNIDPDRIRSAITDKTKAIIPVHFAGRPCDMDKIMSIAREYRLKVIEDAAHAIEAEYHGKKTGTFGDIGCFSFYVTKNITTGEGGMAITDNPEYEEKIKILALHGMTKDAWRRFGDSGYKHYDVIYSGFKYNMMDLQAAIGIHQLPRLEKYKKRRQEIWDRYNAAFKDLPVHTPAPPEADTVHSRHLYTLLLDIDKLGIKRDEFLDKMTERNIGVGVHYTALHLHEFYQDKFGCKRGDHPNAEWISDRTVSLPLSAKLSDDDVKDVIDAVRDILLPKEINLRTKPEPHNTQFIEAMATYDFIKNRVCDKRVLDAGCAYGYGTRLLADYARAVVGLDFDSSTIEWARRHYRQSNITFMISDLRSIGLPDSSSDAVCLFEAIHIIKDTEKVLKELKRVLKIGGQLFISTRNKIDGVIYDDPAHVSIYSPDELRALLTKYGFGQFEFFGLDRPNDVYELERGLEKIRKLDVLGVKRFIPRGLISFLTKAVSYAQRITPPQELKYEDFSIIKDKLDTSPGYLVICTKVEE